MSKTIKLKFNYSTRTFENIGTLDPNTVMKQLLVKGYEDIVLAGVPLKECAEGIHLWVEQDAEILVESYQYLEELYNFLNDGLLEIVASSNGEAVEVVYKLYPGLKKVNLLSFNEKISVNQYLWLWRNTAYDLITFLKS